MLILYKTCQDLRLSLRVRDRQICIEQFACIAQLIPERMTVRFSQGRALMAPYLPRNGVSGSPYSEGGALYALGLIHANHGQASRCDRLARASF